MMLFYCFGNIKLTVIFEQVVNTGIDRLMGCTAVETHGAILTFGDGKFDSHQTEQIFIDIP